AESRGIRVQRLIFRNFAIAVCVEVGQEKSDHGGDGIGENFGGRQPAMAIFVESAERGRSLLDLGWRRFRRHDRHRVMARGCNVHWRHRDKTASTMRRAWPSAAWSKIHTISPAKRCRKWRGCRRSRQTWRKRIIRPPLVSPSPNAGGGPPTRPHSGQTP